MIGLLLRALRWLLRPPANLVDNPSCEVSTAGWSDVPRTYRWRTYGRDGGLPLDQEFDTPEDAGLWRRRHFPGVDDAELTLMAFQHGRETPLTASEMAEAQWWWLWAPDALLVNCPTCRALAGEDCRPFSLTRPHAERERLAAQNAPAAADDGAGA